MIETQHIRLSQAAEMLGVDEDTLLIAAYEGTLRVFGLQKHPIQAEQIRYDWPEDPQGWPERTTLQYGRCWLPFVAVDSDSLRGCLVGGSALASRHMLTEPDASGAFWVVSDLESNETIAIPPRSLFVLRKDIQDIANGRAAPGPHADSHPPSMLGRGFQSNNLSWLMQAARRHWARADPDDPSTHPSISTVAAWLIDKGMSKTLAEKGASIIRPDWAHVGRKPET